MPCAQIPAQITLATEKSVKDSVGQDGGGGWSGARRRTQPDGVPLSIVAGRESLFRCSLIVHSQFVSVNDKDV